MQKGRVSGGIHQRACGYFLRLSQRSVAFCFHLTQGNEEGWVLILALLAETSGACEYEFGQSLVSVSGWLAACTRRVVLLD